MNELDRLHEILGQTQQTPDSPCSRVPGRTDHRGFANPDVARGFRHRHVHHPVGVGEHELGDGCLGGFEELSGAPDPQQAAGTGGGT